MRSSTRKEGLLFAVAAIVAVGLGWATGYLWQSVCLMLLGLLGRHQVHLHRVRRWVESDRNCPPPSHTGVCGEIIDFVLDVERTNRKHKRKLARMLDAFQEAMAALPEAAVVLDKRRRAEWWNAEAERLLGLPRSPGSGPPIGEVISAPEFADYLATGNFENALDLVSPVNPGTKLSVSMVPYGKGKKVLLQARDVTRFSQLEEIRRDFVANTSHELRNPLTVILGYLETMLEVEALRSGPWGRPIGQMHQQAVRIRGIVEDMLTLSTLESAETDDSHQRINLAALLRTIKEEAEILGAEKGHRITLQVEPGSTLQANADEMRSAFSNLVSNAVRYTPPEGAIDLRWWCDEDGGHFSVCDNGIGIAAEHIPRLTERFYRVDTARSRDTGGTGLGLAIVKHALVRTGGHLSIRSEPGAGSTFTCHFPRRLVDDTTGTGSLGQRIAGQANVVPFRGAPSPP